MPTSFAIGDKVKFQEVEGTVAGFRGIKVMVKFGFINLDLLPESLVLVSKKGDLAEDKNETIQIKPSIVTKKIDMLISLEALRFGLAPWGHIKELTIGYEDIEKWATRYFPTNQNDGLTISKIRGDFGEGKSHSLNVIRNIAKETGYLTSWIEVDGNQVTFSRPQTVLQQIWGNLDGLKLTSTTKLLDLHLKAIEKHGEQTVNKKLSPFYRIMHANETIQICKKYNGLDEYGHRIDCVLSSVPEQTTSSLQNEICETLSYPGFITLPPMIGNAVVNRPSDFLEAIIGNAFLAQLAGYKGLVITVDEFEVEDFFNTSKQGRERTESLLEALEDYAQGNTKLPKAPISIFIATVDEGENHSISRVADSSKGGTKNLAKLSREDLHLLARKIFQFYLSGYGLSNTFKEEIIDEVENSFNESDVQTSGYTRSFIKQLMYILDKQYGP